MGTIKQGILGGFSGKVGSVVGAAWKGIAVMRAMPLSVANPRTDPQVAQRNSFSKISKIGSLLLPTVIKPLMNSRVSKMSEYNRFVQLNTGVNRPIPDESVSNLRFSTGKIPEPVFDNIDDFGSAIMLSWVTQTSSDVERADDALYFVLVHKSRPETMSKAYPNVAMRHQGSTSITVENYDGTIKDDFVPYAAWLRQDGKEVSNSAELKFV